MKFLLTVSTLFSALLSIAQPATDIMLFDLKQDGGHIVLSNGYNFTNHKGYDNQPSFSRTKREVLFACANDSGRTDIRVYGYGDPKGFASVTFSHDREYSPTVMPGQKNVSCILQMDDGRQDLVYYQTPEGDGKPVSLVNDLKVGYHAWYNERNVMLFVLEDSGKNTLRYYDIKTKKNSIIGSNIGRCLAKRPGSDQMTFVQIQDDSTAFIRAYDPRTKSIATLCKTLKGKDQYVWLDQRTLLMSDGTDIFMTDPGHSDKWIKIQVEGDRSALKGISRMAVDPTGTKLAVVITE